MKIVIVTEEKGIQLMNLYVTPYTRMFEFLFEFLIVNDGLVGGRPLCRLILYTKVCSTFLV